MTVAPVLAKSVLCQAESVWQWQPTAVQVRPAYLLGRLTQKISWPVLMFACKCQVNMQLLQRVGRQQQHRAQLIFWVG